MWKWLITLAALCLAADADARFPRGTLVATPQITCAMATGVASVGGPCTTPPAAGVCNGDMLTVTRNVTTVTSPSPQNKNLFVSVPTFSAADVGKTIIVPGISASGSTATTTITAFVDSQNVTMAVAALTAVTGVSTSIQYGTDDATVFAQFNVWALANQGSNQVVQTLPTSGSCWFGREQGGGAIKWVAGIKNLVVEGNNSTLDGRTVGWYAGSTGGAICQKGLTDVAGCSARIQTVSAGSNTIQLTAASLAAGYISRFSAPNWVLVAGISTQSLNTPSGSGFPPNPSFFEYRQITNVNAGTGVITLADPLTNAYLSTWPNYSSGDSGNADAGGPATIYAISDALWNTTVEYKNLTMMTVDQINGNGRFVTYRNVSVNGSIPAGGTNNCGMIPSQNVTWSAYNVDWTYCTMENDKVATNAIIDASNGTRVDYQSNSLTNVSISNSTFVNVNGTPLNITITDTTISGTFKPGTGAYGTANKLVCVRCNVAIFDGSGGFQTLPSLLSMSGGVISFLNSDVTGSTGPISRIFGPVPGNIFYQVTGSFSGTIGLFNSQTLTQDPTNTFVGTNEAGGFPTFAGYSGILRPHPAPQFTCDGCLGDPTFVAMNTQLGATPLKPIKEFSKRFYTPSAQGDVGDLLAQGKIVSLTIDVTIAGTAAGSLTLNPTAVSHQETVNQSTWLGYDWVPTINLKQIGTRVITPSGTTCNGVVGPGPGGSCSGDSCTLPASGCYVLPAAVWIKERLAPFMTGTPTGNPTFSIEIKTNQGVVP